VLQILTPGKNISEVAYLSTFDAGRNSDHRNENFGRRSAAVTANVGHPVIPEYDDEWRESVADGFEIVPEQLIADLPDDPAHLVQLWPDQRAGVDFMKPFRLKFTDKKTKNKFVQI
jgi:hypothetical protein